MVPPAVRADLDQVGGELAHLVGQGEQLSWSAGTAVGVTAKAVAVSEEDLSEPYGTAQRTHVVHPATVVARGPNEIGLRIAHLASGEAP